MERCASGIACREIYWNVSAIENRIVMYVLFAISFVIFANGILQRVLLWSRGKRDEVRFRFLLRRCLDFAINVLAQRRTNKRPEAAIFHSLIFWGFVVLLITTSVVAMYADFGFKSWYEGNSYLILTVLSDLFGFGLLLGVLLCYQRRFIQKPDLLHTTRGDAWMLAVLALMVLQGFLLEGIRIAVTEDPWRNYSIIGNAVAATLWRFPPHLLRALHFMTWWFHSVTVFIFIALIPYSKFFHMFSSSINLFFQRNGRPKGALSYPGDLERMLEAAAEDEAGEFNIGVKSLLDLTWKQRLDLDACTSCGRCQEVCPAYNSGKILSPKWLILDSRQHMLSLHTSGKELSEPLSASSFRASDMLRRLDQFLLGFFQMPVIQETSSGPKRGKNPLVQNALRAAGSSATASIAGDLLDPDVFWSCTTCRACMDACPVGIDHVDYILDVRRNLTLIEGELPSEAQSSLRAIETRGNPFGDPGTRSDWASGLEIPMLKAGDSVDVLYWVGCLSAFDRRKQQIAKALSSILNASGLSWGILGNTESCTGDPARRLGEENVFQSAAKKTREILGSIHYSTLVTNCPHCFHSLKNEYPQLGQFPPSPDTRIIHHTQLIHELLQSGQIQLKTKLAEDLTYHDPCYLGRYNNSYEEPREILVQLGGRPLKEMDLSRERGMCCGAGGGHFFMDMKVGERVNVLRVNQAAETGASVVATACPFCMHMVEDGTKLTNREDTLRVRDIAELVAEAMVAHDSEHH